jgi:hypothetical protein
MASNQNPALDTLMPSSADDGATSVKREVDLNYQAKFYLRIPFTDRLGIIGKTGALAETHGVSIDAILQNPITDKEKADVPVTTDICQVSAIQALCADIATQEFSRGEPVYMPLQFGE